MKLLFTIMTSANVFCLMSTWSSRKVFITRKSCTMMLHTKIFYNDVYEVQLAENHRFPMAKYRVVRQSLQQEFAHHRNVSFHVSPLATQNELQTTHSSEYIDRYITGKLLEKEIRKIGFPWSLAHVQRSTSSVGGTLAAMRSILDNYDSAHVGCHVAGGTHHAFYDYGEGYCIFSDIAVAANVALRDYPEYIKKILIIDLDVHQGNGNAVLFQQKPHVFTFSMHCKSNYFSTIQQSDLDIELDSGCQDEEYLSKLKEIIPNLLDTFQPDLVFYQAGVDIHQYDRLGKLSITRQGISQRNHIVYEAIKNRQKDRHLKLVVTMGGGYPKNMDPTSLYFQEIIESHKDVYRDCINVFYDTS